MKVVCITTCRFKRAVALAGLFVAANVWTAGAASGQSFTSSERTPTYAQLCQDEGSVCSRFTTGSVPIWLIRRPLHFPTIREGGACPVSRGKVMSSNYVNGVAYGAGPVRLLVAMNMGSVPAADVELLPSDTPGWLAFKTTWVVTPSYQGPVIVRAKEIAGSGQVALLGGASAGPIVVPPGPTVNDRLGTRTAPIGTYVSGPGCFAFQIDGKGFDEHIVVRAVENTAG
jgi:hypothetical protein